MKQQYFAAVKIRRSATEVNRLSPLHETLPTNVDVEIYPAWTTRKVYICPRGIDVHKGNPKGCGRACMKVQGNADDMYEEELELRVIMVEKQVLFNTRAFMEGLAQ